MHSTTFRPPAKSTRAQSALDQLKLWAVAHGVTVQLVSTLSVAQRQPETHAAFDPATGLIAIAKGPDFTVYDVREFPTPWEGRAWQLTKIRTGETHEVFVAADGSGHICDCLGFSHTGHCRHVDCLTALSPAGCVPDAPQLVTASPDIDPFA